MRSKLVSLFMLSLFSAIVMIAVLVAGYYAIVYRNIVNENDRDTQTSLDDAVNRIEKELAINMESGDVIANYGDTIAEFMKGDSIKRLEMRDSVRFLLSMQLELQAGLKFICVYPQDGGRMFIGSSAILESERTAGLKILNQIIQDYNLRSLQKRIQVTRSYHSHEEILYAIVVPVFQSVGDRYLGTMILLYNGENIQNVLQGKSKRQFIVINGQEPIATTGNEINTLWKEGSVQRLKQASLSTVDWTVYALTSTQALIDTTSSLWKFCIMVFISTGIAFGALIAFQYQKIVGPILAIARQAAAIGDDPTKEIDIFFGVNEYDNLIQSINTMLTSQRKMSAEMLQVRTQIYQEQISFLQSQINPHFLYNCLESIRGMAGKEMIRAVRDMVSGIAMIYRYCSKGGHYVTLREEVACAKNYTRVMNLCYSSAYHVDFQISEDTGDMPVPRMILQPLIENAILHGLSGQTKEAGSIWISAVHKDEGLTLSIEDNGCGISQEQLADWNSGWTIWSEMYSEKIGLTNVMRRVWLLYGDQAQVRFSARDGGRGLRIVFSLKAPNTQECTKWLINAC